MSMEKFLMVSLLALALALLALAPAPVAATPLVRHDLSDVLNRTVCPILVEVDEDTARVPRRIKMLKCAEAPTHWCHHQGIPDNECCSHSHAGRVMQCVEIMDTVLVRYPATDTTMTYQVSVGCTCLISHSSRATPAT